MKRIGLREARRRARLTQVELAQLIDKPQSFISRLENGVSEPSLHDAVAIGRVLGVDPLALRFGHSSERAGVAS